MKKPFYNLYCIGLFVNSPYREKMQNYCKKVEKESKITKIRCFAVMEKKNSFVFNISEEDSRKLQQILEERAFLITSLPYARYKAVKEKVNVTS